MSKGLKKILPVAAMFIPVIGPAIGAKIGLTGALAGLGAKVGLGAAAAKVGAVASSALVGGALNKAAGGSFAQGAFAGGLGGLTAGAPKPMAARVGEGLTDMRGLVDAASGVAKSAAAPATLGSRIMGAISSVGGQISQGLTNPDMWGRAAQYLGAAALGKATAKPDPALQAYINELQRVSADNRTIQQAAFGVGNELVAQARGINPIAEGQIAANEAQLRVLGAGQQAVRNVDPSKEALRAVGTQQYYTDAARAGASAFNVGFRGARADRQAGLQGAYSGTPILQAQGGSAAQLSMQQAQNEGTRQAGLLESLKYITTGQQPTGQQTQGQQPMGGLGTPPIVPPGSVTGRAVLPDPNNPVYGTVGI
jgi:hypothetical protein